MKIRQNQRGRPFRSSRRGLIRLFTRQDSFTNSEIKFTSARAQSVWGKIKSRLDKDSSSKKERSLPNTNLSYFQMVRSLIKSKLSKSYLNKQVAKRQKREKLRGVKNTQTKVKGGYLRRLRKKIANIRPKEYKKSTKLDETLKELDESKTQEEKELLLKNTLSSMLVLKSCCKRLLAASIYDSTKKHEELEDLNKEERKEFIKNLGSSGVNTLLEMGLINNKQKTLLEELIDIFSEDFFISVESEIKKNMKHTSPAMLVLMKKALSSELTSIAESISSQKDKISKEMKELDQKNALQELQALITESGLLSYEQKQDLSQTAIKAKTILEVFSKLTYEDTSSKE